MGITLKTDPNKGWQTAAMFGVDPALIKAAQENGNIQIVMQKLGTYVVKNAVTVFATIPITTTSLTLAQQKLMGPASMAQYRAHFENGLKAALAATEYAKKVPSAASPSPMELMPTPTPTPPPTAAPKAFKPVSTAGAAAKVGTPVKLFDATELYQPVGGTSPSSIYYTFALFPGLKLAARISGNKLSVRAEGWALPKYVETLKEQFKIDLSVGYASGHYIVDEGASLMVKTLAAIVGVLGFEKIEKVADLNKFVKDLAV